MAIQYDSGAITATLTAEGDLSSNQYHLVKFDTAQNLSCAAVAAVTDQPIGVLTNKPTDEQAASIVLAGVTKVKCGGSVTRGDLLKVTADGRVQTAAVGQGNNFATIGQALTTGAANEIITAAINCLGAGNREA